MKKNEIVIRLMAGSWSALLEEGSTAGDASLWPIWKGPFDVILASETIYQPSSLGTLVKLLQRAANPQRPAQVPLAF